MFSVYVLLNAKYSLYVGYSENPHNRLLEHNAGIVHSTSKGRPWRHIFLEYFLEKKDALRREQYFKTTQGKRMLKILLKTALHKAK